MSKPMKNLTITQIIKSAAVAIKDVKTWTFGTGIYIQINHNEVHTDVQTYLTDGRLLIGLYPVGDVVGDHQTTLEVLQPHFTNKFTVSKVDVGRGTTTLLVQKLKLKKGKVFAGNSDDIDRKPRKAIETIDIVF